MLQDRRYRETASFLYKSIPTWKIHHSLWWAVSVMNDSCLQKKHQIATPFTLSRDTQDLSVMKPSTPGLYNLYSGGSALLLASCFA